MNPSDSNSSANGRPLNPNQPADVLAVDRVLRERRTRKVLAGAGVGEQHDLFLRGLRESLELAGMAPFHYPRTDAIPEPWRFHVFTGDALRNAQKQLADADLLYGKLPRIFEHAGAVVLVTWLPETEDTVKTEARNWEHAAATSAATQNLLLATEARGIGSYWCSAPILGEAAALKIWGAGAGEVVLGEIFLGWPLSPADEAELGWSGKMRERRTPPDSGWCRWA
jgi:nitroreductase